MRYIDISRVIEDGMDRYPTDPNVKINQFKSLKKGNSCNLSVLSFGSHAGTHIDAPLHILNKGKGVDKLGLKDLMCEVAVVNAKEFSQKALSQILKFKKVKGILFKTDKVLTFKEASLVVKNNIKVIGTENMSIEEASDKTHPVHRLLLSKGVIIIESLFLKNVKVGYYRLICLPLKIKEGDGAPARAVLACD